MQTPLRSRSHPTTESVIGKLGFRAEIESLCEILHLWLKRSNSEIRRLLEWQFGDRSKYFRPLTVFSCYRAMESGPITDSIMQAAAVLEMIHNVSLIVDDIVDQSEERRGKTTLYRKFGLLPALMTSGYIVADGYQMLAWDPFDISLFSELLKRLAIAECLQWRLRRRPLGVEDWFKIAGEDTGSMFETCACLATRGDSLRKFGHLLGVLYHGCDDVGDIKGLESLGGGGEEDLRDGILTLPASLALADSGIAALFCKRQRSDRELVEIGAAMRRKLPEAEAYLDKLAVQAKKEARLCSPNPAPLLALVDHTRELSNW